MEAHKPGPAIKVRLIEPHSRSDFNAILTGNHKMCAHVSKRSIGANWDQTPKNSQQTPSELGANSVQFRNKIAANSEEIWDKNFPHKLGTNSKQTRNNNGTN